MDKPSDPPIGNLRHNQPEGSPPPGFTAVNRRDLLKLTLCGGAGLALDGLVDVPAARAATRQFKLSEVSEFTTSCNFCSCGCGMIAAVRDGKLIAMEGDYDHIVSRGSLCVKGISMFATHASPKRLTKPLYRAPGSDHWEDISWKDAAERIARKIKKVRDETWVATEKLGDRDVPINRTDAIAFLGARRTRTRSATSSRRRPGCSASRTSSTRPDFDTAPRSPVRGPRSGGGR